MKPQEYKSKLVLHVPTGARFVVAGGGSKNGQWLLKDSDGNRYSLEECELAEQLNLLDFDVRKLKGIKNVQALHKFCQTIGNERFQDAWSELEKDPVEAATVAILYFDNWQGFCTLTQAYGVTYEQSLELNQKFRDRLRDKGLNEMVANWYADKEAA